MKCIHFACLFLCLTTTFLLSQSNPVALTNQSPTVVPTGTPLVYSAYLGGSGQEGSGVVVKITRALSSFPNPSAYGQTVVFTATFTSSLAAPPDGDPVTFEQASRVLGTGTLKGGKATFSISTLAVGRTAITAVYSGDVSFLGFRTSNGVSQVISKATSTTILTSSQNPSTEGRTVTFTATVVPQFSGTPTGTVVFYDGTTKLKDVTLSGGAAEFTTSKLTSGTHNITAKYDGSADFTDSTSPAVTHTVD